MNALGHTIGASEALRRADKRFRSLLMVTSDVVWTASASGELIEPQIAWQDYTGQTWEQAKGFGWAEAIHPDDRSSVMRDWLSAVATSSVYRTRGRVWSQKHASYRAFQSRGIPVFRDDGEIEEWVGTLTDVQETLDAQQQLQETEARSARQVAELEAIYDQAPVGLCVLSTDLRYIRINRRLAETNGLPPEAHIGKTTGAITPALADQLESVARQVLRTGCPIFAHEIVGSTPAHPNACCTWLSTWFPHKDDRGHVVSISCMFEEITERKEVEKALREKAAELDAVLNAVPGGIYIAHDRECRTMIGNDECRQMLRLPPGISVSKSAPPGEAPTHFRVIKNGVEIPPSELPIQQAAASGRPIRNFELQLEFDDGLIKHIYGNATPLFELSGETRGAVGAFIDVTELVATREERWRSIFETSKLGITMIDQGLHYMASNPAFRAMLGYTEEELRQLTPLDVTLEEEREVAQIRLTELQQRKVDHYVVVKKYRRKDGSVMWGHSSIVRAVVSKPEIFIGTTIDITESRRAQDKLRETQSELARVTRLTAMGQIAASIAHEINQPLAAIVSGGSAGLRWLSKPTPDLDEARAALKSIVSNGNRASEVIDGIRAMFKNDSRERALLDVNQVIREVLALHQGELEDHRIQVRTELSPDAPPVFAARVPMQQVVANLVTNAIEAMEAVESRARTLQLKSAAFATDGVLITVEDSGPGIDQENLERIFDPFFTTRSQGMGMGLSICRSIIEAHNGRLSASSAIGKGSLFRIILPIKTEAASVAAVEWARDSANAPPAEVEL